MSKRIGKTNTERSREKRARDKATRYIPETNIVADIVQTVKKEQIIPRKVTDWEKQIGRTYILKIGQTIPYIYHHDCSYMCDEDGEGFYATDFDIDPYTDLLDNVVIPEAEAYLKHTLF